ncbi:hypothetical protein [Roseateles koreensis]|uniref:Uncharacterized protein n=1 Tax=Roseateles koreensis TaxID=2987526 RepID=A0ABT5KQ44_9BURK|nr:hypothetical protein [Roseateles koreensis]MDC8785034.1 hypothetical protein [Roseateles koreensis]
MWRPLAFLKKSLAHRAAFVVSVHIAALGLAVFAAPAQASLQSISDDELATVHARDGFAFNLQGFSLNGSLSLRLGSSTDASGVSLNNISLSRSDDTANTYTDPYQLTLVQRGGGLPDKVVLSEPLNAQGLILWQFAADLELTDANSNTFKAGALLLQNLRSSGTTLEIAPNADADVQGIALGLGLRLDLGALTLRPRGRLDTTLIDDPTTAEQFTLRGLHLGAATADGQQLSPTGLWQLSSLSNQPLLINTVTAADGSTALHLNIAWPSAGQTAPVGSVLIDNISFKSDVGGNVDLGSSRIGGVQIQYLDIKLKSGR